MTKTIAERYQILEKLGAGGMGTVYKGLDTQTQTTVAIKQLKPEMVRSELIERFQREGQALRELNHPNMVKMLDAVEEDGSHYLIMDYVSGGDLRKLIEQGQLPIEQIVQLSIDLADALTRAHRLDIIHRDLKPANILIAEDGTPRLTDFGVAYMANKERVTGTNAIVGTIDYLAPEAFQDEAIDNRTDIWAFGVMLFEMLTREKPFKGESVTQIIYQIMSGDIPDLEDLREDAPIALVDLVYRMLERDKNARIASIRHVGAALEDILLGRSTDTPPETRFSTPIPNIFERAKHNLPSQVTEFVGRKGELAELAKLLEDPKIRLLTILAPGGMGKTRLSLEAAERQIENFTDGVYFVELASLSDVASIVPTIAEAVGYQFQQDEREPKQQVFDFLANKTMLLVMDNYEHIMEGASLVTEILNAAPDVQVLATSRRRLEQAGETLFHLSGMDFPKWETPEDALDYAAVKLFMQGAKRARPDFELRADNLDAVARICRLVAGMPLGIVLAAAWLGLLSIEEVAEELQQGIDFLETDGGDVPERQRSIRAVFDYSWQMMSEAEQEIFMKMSIFRGGFTREAAQTVTGANLRNLMKLVNKSLIRRDADSGRYHIHELLRQYAREQLSASDNDSSVKDKHSAYYIDYLAKLGSNFRGKQLILALDALEKELDNIRMAWDWEIQYRKLDNLEEAAQCLQLFYSTRDLHAEGEKAFSPAVDILREKDATEDKLLLGQFLMYYGRFARLQFKNDIAHKLFEESYHIFQALDNQYELAAVLEQQGYLAHLNGESELASTLLQDSLKIRRQIGDKSGTAYTLWRLGDLLGGSHFSQYDTAVNYLDESVQIFREIEDYRGLAEALRRLAQTLGSLKRYEEAKTVLNESLPLFVSFKSDGLIASVYYSHSHIEYSNQQYNEAFDWAEKGLKLLRNLGDKRRLENFLLSLGFISWVQGDFQKAKNYMDEARSSLVADNPNPRVIANAKINLGHILTDLGDVDKAKKCYREAIERGLVMEKIPRELTLTEVVFGLARIYARRGDKIRAVEWLSLGISHKGTNPEVKALAERVYDELASELDEEAYQAASERGKSLDLEVIVQEWLAEFGEDEA